MGVAKLRTAVIVIELRLCRDTKAVKTREPGSDFSTPLEN